MAPKLNDKQRNYADREKQIRQTNITNRAGKDLRYNEDQMIGLMINRNPGINTSMQHCIIKVYRKMSGGAKEKFLAAFNICSAVFEKNGYMNPASFTENRLSAAQSLTSKGLRNNMRHREEVDSGFKESVYDGLESRLWTGAINRAKEAAKAPPEKSPSGTKTAKSRMKRED